MNEPGGEVLAIVEERATVRLFERLFASHPSSALVTQDLGEGLALASDRKPLLAFVDVSLGQNAGLALVHHLLAVSPNTVVYALAQPNALQVGSQAAALGAAGLFVLPLSGDEVLSALARARGARAAAADLCRLELAAENSRRGMEWAAEIAELSQLDDRTSAARRLVHIFSGAFRCTTAAIYVPASEGSNELVRVAAAGDLAGAPSFTDEMGLMTFAREVNLHLAPLQLGKMAAGHVLFSPDSAASPHGEFTQDGDIALRELLCGQAATMLTLLSERERSTRGAIKDQSTSAYTFAYFVDIAGREIDKARRYGRRFALATISLESPGSAASTHLAEVVLSAVRDTDVLARVDEQEFYLLMPETGGVGAQSCRRRVLERAGAQGGRRSGEGPPQQLTMGVATYPHDGTNLSKLLRTAKRRAEAARTSHVLHMGLERLPLSDIVDTLVRQANTSTPAGLECVRRLEISVTDAIGLGLSSVREAVRGGRSFVAVTHHPGLSMSSSIRGALSHEQDGVALHALDLRASAGYESLQLLSVIAEHGAYVFAGRLEQGMLRGIHGSDPLLVDLLTQRLGQVAGVRLLD